MEYTQVIQQEIEDLLRQKIGLNPESVGSNSILRAVKKGMRADKMQGLSNYLSSLRSSPMLFEALVESIVVPETSFFRNRTSFVFLRQWLAQEWLNPSNNRPANRPLRILSLPCSTGEEPYSIAISLLEEGLSLDGFHIDAVDISAIAIAKAKEGVYSPYAFRRQTYRSDDKYFVLGVPAGAKGKRTTQRYFLKEAIRQKISFIQGNVLDPKLLDGALPYDIVFCRNLLIYLDEDARNHASTLIDRLLKPHGLLFVGYAETGLVDLTRYKLVSYPQTFAFRKQKADQEEDGLASCSSLHRSLHKQIAVPVVADSITDRQSAADRFSTESIHHKQPAHEQPAHEQPAHEQPAHEQLAHEQLAESHSGLLNIARSLADKGEIEASVAQCDRYLRAFPADAQAHLLRGELYVATGENAAAEAYFKKAVYLNPQMIEALTHLMLLKAEQHKLEEVSIIRSRIERLAELGT